MLDEEVKSHKGILPKLNFYGYFVFYEVGLIIAVNRITFSIIQQVFLLFAC